MRKILLLSAFSLFLVACSSDDDAPAPADPIVGTWKMTSYEVENSYDFNNDGTANRDLLIETNCYQNETIQINEGGAAIVLSNSFLTVVAELVVGTTDEFTYTLNCENEAEITTTNWTLNGTSLSFQEEDGFTIIATYNGSNQFSFTVPEGFEIFSGGFNAVAEEDVTITYTKQ
ncbi:MAG: hypothetical protein AB8B65_17295 [Kordia sp.]|uniref:hypothetical protein n=1 Tax=Kordia sp. TaxID=1965332 RepID=UPI00385E2741